MFLYRNDGILVYFLYRNDSIRVLNRNVVGILV